MATTRCTLTLELTKTNSAGKVTAQRTIPGVVEDVDWEDDRDIERFHRKVHHNHPGWHVNWVMTMEQPL